DAHGRVQTNTPRRTASSRVWRMWRDGRFWVHGRLGSRRVLISAEAISKSLRVDSSRDDSPECALARDIAGTALRRRLPFAEGVVKDVVKRAIAYARAGMNPRRRNT